MLQCDDDGKGHFALPQVTPHGFAETLLLAGKVQGIINELKCAPEGDAEAAQAFAALRRETAEHAANITTGAKQGRGLLANNLLVLGPRQTGVPNSQGLHHLPFGHRHGDPGDFLENLWVAVIDNECHRLGIEKIADQNGEGTAPAGIHRGMAATQMRMVDDIVVQEGGRMHELDHGRQGKDALTGIPGQLRSKE